MLQRARLLTFVVLVTILVAFCVLEVRLFCIQVAHGTEHVDRAEARQTRTVGIVAPRGRIVDCRGRILAASIPSIDIYANTRWIENPYTKIRCEKNETLDILANLLDLDRREFGAKIDRYIARDKKDDKNLSVCVARRVTDQEVIRKLFGYKEDGFLRGVDIEKGFVRTYPQGSLLGLTLGRVDYEGKGIFGVEALACESLRGEAGSRSFRKDGTKREIFSADSVERGARPGGDLKLTIDATLQLFSEMEMDRIFREYEPKWASAVVMEPSTGRILAAASVPALDMGNGTSGGKGYWNNNSFHEEYKPGSTFKPLAMAMALDAGVVDLTQKIDCENGRWRIGRRTVTDDHGSSTLLPEEIIVHSSNIGISKLVLRLVPEDAPRGSEAFAPILERFRRLGLGKRTGVLLPREEVTGRLTPLRKWSRVYTLVSVSFGYEMTVTAVQMAAAFSTLANGGVYIPPRLVESFSDREGNVIELPQAPSCRVFSGESTRTVTRMLVRVVEEGTGKPARIAGCAVAGKTGTAQKDSDRSKHTPSFVAFAPAEKPALLVLVVVDEPKGAYYGSKVAAPAVRNILEKGLAYLGVGQKEMVCAGGGRQGDVDR
jgi:cell division protein FtsI/penicillin-binding protein 2